MQEVLSIIADVQAAEEETLAVMAARRAKDAARKIRGKSAENPVPGDGKSVPEAETAEQPRVTSTYPEEPQENLSQKDPLTGGPKSSSLPKPKGRGTRLGADWVLPMPGRDYAASIGVPSTVIDREAEKFRDFWIAKAGANGVKLDWDATWRNWIRRVADERGFAPPEAAATGPPASGWKPGMPTDAELRAKYTRMADESRERAEQSRGVLPVGRGLHRPAEAGDRPQPGDGDPAGRSGMASLGSVLPRSLALAAGGDADGSERDGAVHDGPLPMARMAR